LADYHSIHDSSAISGHAIGHCTTGPLQSITAPHGVILNYNTMSHARFFLRAIKTSQQLGKQVAGIRSSDNMLCGVSRK